MFKVREDGSPGNSSWLNVYLLDVQFSSTSNITILLAASNLQDPDSNSLHYALASLSSIQEATPMKFCEFCILKHQSHLGQGYEKSGVGGNRAKPFNYRLLTFGGQFAYVFNSEGIMCCTVTLDEDEPDNIDFKSGGNGILGSGGGNGESAAIFFTLSQGLVNVAPNTANTMMSASINQSMMMNESRTGGGGGFMSTSKLSESLCLNVSQAGLENMTMSEDKNDQLKAAFLLFCKRDIAQSIKLVENLFPNPDSPDFAAVDSSLDRVVVHMSRDLIDDFPASDPRWMESLPGTPVSAMNSLGGLMSSGGVGGVGVASTSLLILHQLEDKQTALDFYISFLKEVDLWDKFGSLTVRDFTMPTVTALSEHVEKTAAAIALRTIHNE